MKGHQIVVLLKKDLARETKLQAALAELNEPQDWKVIDYEDKSELRNILASLKSQGFEKALIGGGDGSLHCAVEEVLKLDIDQRIPLGVAPLGTANDFAHSTTPFVELGLPAALRAAAESPIEWVDVGWVNEVPFLNVVTGGDLTKATTDVSKLMKETLGKFAYFIKALTQLPNLQSYKMNFRSPGWELDVNCLGFAVANARSVGGGLKVAPTAKLNDGLLDLLIVPQLSPVELSRLAAELMKETPDLGNHHIIRRQVTDLRIDCDTEFQVNADGEPLKGCHFDFRIMPRFLQMTLPRQEALMASPWS